MLEGPTGSQGEALEITSPDQVLRISAADARALVDRGDAVLYDVRTAQAYRDLHVVGAVSFPEADLDSLYDTLPADKSLIFCCT